MPALFWRISLLRGMPKSVEPPLGVKILSVLALLTGLILILSLGLLGVLDLRCGKEKAVVAVAHKMTRIVCFMLMIDEPYRDENVKLATRKLKRMEGRASSSLRI